MNVIYTLFGNTGSEFAAEVIPLIETASGLDIFDSKELLDYLDKHRVEAPEWLVQKVMDFNSRTCYAKLLEPEFIEITLN